MLASRQEQIDAIFGSETVEQMISALEVGTEEWQGKALAATKTRSPLSLKLTLEAIRQARNMQNLEDALNLEYRLTTRLFNCGEFVEGVRALLVDKDKAPKWNPATLGGVGDELIAEFLGPLPDGEELNLKAPQR